MAIFKVTQTDCAQILQLPKIIEQDVHWSSKTDSWSEAALEVKSKMPGKLELRITVNSALPSKFSMTLLLNQTYRIKGLDINGSHSNKCTDKQVWVCKTHKHDWSDACPDGHAYTPNDITGSTIDEVLRQFCKECNIEFKGSFRPVPIRQRMTGV